jgi:stage V sporulation protein B
VLDLLFNGEGIEMGSVLLTYLSVSLIFMSPLLVLNSALEAQGEIKAPMISMIIGSVFKLIISYILISNPNFGILGAPLGTIASYVIAFGVSVVIAYKRKGIVLPIIKTISLPIINSFIAIIAVYPIYLKGYNANSTLSFIVAVLFTMLIYILLSVSKDFVSNLKNLRMQNAQSQS